MSNSNRRDFIKKSSLAAAGLSFATGTSAASYKRIIGANDRLNIAFIGLGRRVGAYVPSLEKKNNVRLAYLCDVKKSQIDRALEELKDILPYKPNTTEDMLEVFGDKDVDAIFNATPDHWHAPGSWMAMEQGKHVYVEKPCSHNPWEGELLVQYAKKYDKVIQMGNQQRSSYHTIEIIKEIQNGIIGDAYKAVAYYNNSRGEVPQQIKQAAPSDLNWDLWQGPAPRQDYFHNTWDYNWHWYGWNWGTAETGNNATHELDVARWALQLEFPNKVTTDSGKRHYKDDGWEMYDTMYATFEFDNGKTINWDGKSRNGYSTYTGGRGTVIYGTEGTVLVDREHYEVFDRSGKKVKEKSSGSSEGGLVLGGGGDMSTDHVVNFYDAIRGQAKLNSPIDEGAKSSLLCHLANISSRLNKSLELDSSNGHIFDREGMKLWERQYAAGFEPII
ncbi:Gfo/Idh/MocA family protein [Chondrinema litorale]|uniref:Gfo/Idh/MocA family protein n=1 Tax=Chondrinema litorale TaxID=2994555 RepID=UPI002543DB1F|nr:Gfo/Idh/MocA family oxidoreductase [Chondrinema litorale]UZR98476.1 Gfo/Idh/MocA family oxidoreductase [Chondrinema litorale]